MHSNEECKVKCSAIKTLLTQIVEVAGMNNDYTTRSLAESALDLVRELKQEIKESK